MAEKEQRDDDAGDDEQIVLPTKVRVLAGAVAVVLLTFCVILIWRGRDGGAVIALVVAGGVPGLLALIGELPSRLVIGGNEAHWRTQYSNEKDRRIDAETEVQAVAAALPDEALQQAISRVDAVAAEEVPTGPSLLAQIAAWRERSLAHLSEAVATIGATVDYEVDYSQEMPSAGRIGTMRYRPDAVVTRDGREVLVDLMRLTTVPKVDNVRHIAMLLQKPILVVAETGRMRRFTDGTSDATAVIVARNSVVVLITALSELLDEDR